MWVFIVAVVVVCMLLLCVCCCHCCVCVVMCVHVGVLLLACTWPIVDCIIYREITTVFRKKFFLSSSAALSYYATQSLRAGWKLQAAVHLYLLDPQRSMEASVSGLYLLSTSEAAYRSLISVI